MGKSPHQYYEEVIGKGFDEDGVYGIQCVDGFKHFCRTQLDYNISHRTICSPTGYATSIWDNFESLGLDKYFDKVPSNQMVDGDWAIWSYNLSNRSCPYSHVAMFRRDNGDGTGVFLGENQTASRVFTQRNLYYDGLRGGMRPKIYHQNKYINIPPTIEVRNIYTLDTKTQFATIKPKKFGGLSYKIYSIDGNYAEIETVDYGRCYVKITAMTPITDVPMYTHGNY